MRGNLRIAVATVSALAAALTFAPGASAADPFKLTADSPREQGKMVHLQVEAANAEPLEFLRLTGSIRTGGESYPFEPLRTGELKAKRTHIYRLRQTHPGDREVVRQALKRGKTLTARIRCDFHPDGGDVAIRKIQVDLVYAGS